MYDVVIVGAGVIGSSIARELSRFKLKTVVLERGYDVALGSSRANSGIVHGGHDAAPGSRKAYFNVRGNAMFDRVSRELDFPFRRCGSLVLAFGAEDLSRLDGLIAQGEKNGVRGLRIVSGGELRAMEPNLSGDVRAALWVPAGGIVCPYEMTIAYAENAVANGVEFRLNTEVTALERWGGVFRVATPRGTLEAKVLINAAGLHGDTINNMLSKHKLHITPRKGEYCLLDRAHGGLVSHTLFQLPTEMGKGILVTPTVDGNILLGPTARDIRDRGDTSTTRAGLAQVLKRAALDVTHLPTDGVITAFAGLRAHLPGDDFVIGPAEDVENLINVCGIASPGLTSAPAIAGEVAELAAGMLSAGENRAFHPLRVAPPRFRHMDRGERDALIREHPDYGQVVCRCEQVTKGEVVAALRSPLGVRDLDAVKRRTRAGMGRCQGGFCAMRLPEIIAGELNIPLTEVTKCGPGTNLLVRENKAGERGRDR